ncbi:group 3/4 sigma-70 RNA polymerase sigma factor [Nostoc minutum NIES-26]|uniref:Group 3/4 sigma-70 RNA polymerase sigma factor n=1 Tax=Nostoc minutum NIES-26 TaxID=1844469 RepID=A0A367QPL6_9NOSO|nr:group 3/4 sigma-70 RNA polymerase sigma factor [Nostoc minutum NIES-26]
MQSRQGIIEIFSTFVQLDADRFAAWVTDTKLRRSMKQCLEKSPQQQSDRFWVLYWYKIWQIQSSPLAVAHISAYLQEVCYWVARKIALNFPSQFSVADCFQIAISYIHKILKNFNPEYSTNLKSYAEFAFEGYIKDSLRLVREAHICTDRALLHKISRKRLVNSLENAGFNDRIINSYVLAWECFKELYATDNQTIRQMGKPDTATWQEITNLYNRQRLNQLSSPTPAVTPQTLEEWLSVCAKAVRDFLYPKFVSVDAPMNGQETGNLLDTIPADQTSLLTEIILQEEAATRKKQQAELNTILLNALAALDIQSQNLLQVYYDKKLTQQQIAGQLEIKQYTVSRHLSNIKRSLLINLTQWSVNTLHISPTPVVVDSMSKTLEEWLKIHFSHVNPHV